MDIAELGIKIVTDGAEAAASTLEKLTSSAQKAETAGDRLESMFKKLLIILGPTALAAMFVSHTKHVIDLQDEYVRLGEIAGVTSSKISSLDLPARLSGTSIDAVAQSVAKLSRAVGEAQLGDPSKRSLFKALGIDPNDGLDPVARFEQVSRALLSMKDQNVQAYVSTQLLSRGFAEMRPIMKEIVEQGGLQARTTDEQNERAKRFNDTLTKIKFEMENTKIKMVEQLIGPLQEVATAFYEAYKSGGLFEGVLASLRAALTGTDMQKAAADIKFLEERIADTWKKIEENSKNKPNFIERAFGIGENDDVELAAQMRQLQDRLKLITNYRNSLLEQQKKDEEAAAKKKTATEPGAGGNSAEAGVRKMMEDQRMYEARVAAEKGFYETFADGIKFGNAMVAEQRKREEISEEDAVRQLSKNEDQRLQVLVNSLEQQRKLHENKGELGKSSEAGEQIKQANAARIDNERLTIEKIKTLRDVENSNYMRDIAVKSAEQTRGLLDERSLLEEWLAEQNNLNEIAFNIGLRDKEEYESRYAEIHARYAEERVRITDDELKKQFNISKVHRKIDLDSASTFFSNMASLMQTKHRALWEIGKVAAIGETVINTARAAMGAYAALAPIPVVGPALATAAAAAAIAAGFAQVANIKAQSFDGGGGAAATFSASPTTGLPTAPIGQENQPAQGGTTTIVHLNGTIFSDQQVRDLVEKINENSRNGGLVIVS